MPTCEKAKVKILDRNHKFTREKVDVAFTFHPQNGKIIIGVNILDDGSRATKSPVLSGEDIVLKTFGSCDAGFGRVFVNGSEDEKRFFLITKSEFKQEGACCDAKELVFAEQLTDLSLEELVLFFKKIVRAKLEPKPNPKREPLTCGDVELPFPFMAPYRADAPPVKTKKATATKKKTSRAAKKATGGRSATRA